MSQDDDFKCFVKHELLNDLNFKTHNFYPKLHILFSFMTYILLLIQSNHNQVIVNCREKLSHINIYSFTAVNLKTIRIPGVLQRFSLTYLVLGLFEVCFARYDTPEKYQVQQRYLQNLIVGYRKILSKVDYLMHYRFLIKREELKSASNCEKNILLILNSCFYFLTDVN